jgi:hypothetical protein
LPKRKGLKVLLQEGTGEIGTWQSIAVILVLLAALYQLADTIYHQVRIHTRRKVLSRLLSEGHTLQNARFSDRNLDGLLPSKMAVDAWFKETTSTLRTYSSKAAAFFESVTVPGAPPGTLSADEIFLLRLDNLRTILERPDLYYY